YKCLRSYKNKWDHKYFDRRLATAFIRHILFGETPTITVEEEHQLLRPLARELTESGHRVEEVKGGLRLPDVDGRIVVLGHPLTPDEPGSAAARELFQTNMQVVVIDKLLVDRALPAAVQVATGARQVEVRNQELPAFLRQAQSG